jgi:hypothetical protein
MVQHVRVGRTGVSPAAVVLGNRGVDQRYESPRIHKHLIRVMLTLCNTDDPRLPVHLLVYAVQVTVTTATCIADYLSWSEFSDAQKLELGKLYVPYLALGMLCLSLLFPLIFFP